LGCVSVGGTITLAAVILVEVRVIRIDNTLTVSWVLKLFN